MSSPLIKVTSCRLRIFLRPSDAVKGSHESNACKRRESGDQSVPFVQPSEQASHNGDLVHAVEAGAVGRGDVTELGAVLGGMEEGRHGKDEMTVFDSTGLAIQDLAIALAALERADDLDLPVLEL